MYALCSIALHAFLNCPTFNANEEAVAICYPVFPPKHSYLLLLVFFFAATDKRRCARNVSMPACGIAHGYEQNSPPEIAQDLFLAKVSLIRVITYFRRFQHVIYWYFSALLSLLLCLCVVFRALMMCLRIKTRVDNTDHVFAGGYYYFITVQCIIQCLNW